MSMKKMTIAGGVPLRGMIEVPGDKSITHRALILASMAEGTSRITNPSTAGDCLSTARVMGMLGAGVTIGRGDFTIVGRGPDGFIEPASVLDFGNSGTGMRLTAGAVASCPVRAVLDGDDSLRKRPMDRIIIPLRLMGADLRGREGDRFPPLSVKGGQLHGIRYESPVASAQVKSSVLIAACRAGGETVFTEPRLSRDHTERIMPMFGASPKESHSGIHITGPLCLKAADITVPGDISSAAFWIVGALIVPGSELIIHGVGLNPTRTGFLEVLAGMGADLTWEVQGESGKEPVGNIKASYSTLSGTTITADMIPSCVDELPILAVAATAAEGITTISGASELRVKESDRIAAMASQLSALGGQIEERSDGLVIKGGQPLDGANLQSFGDHRIAMSLAIAALTARGSTVIMDTGNIDTSYPEFGKTLRKLHGRR